MKPLLLVLIFVPLAAALAGWADDAAALPENSPAEQWKKAALTVAAERLASRAEAGEDTTALAAEFRAALQQPAEEFQPTLPAVPGTLSVLQPLRDAGDNPYLKNLETGIGLELNRLDADWPVRRGDEPLFGEATSQGEYNPRLTAARMDALLWLLANPASPRRDDPEILRRLLRRVLAYGDAIGRSEKFRGGQGVFDDFALAPALIVLREFLGLYPATMLPAERESLRQALRTAGDRVHGHARGHLERHPKGYANIDMAMSLEMLNFGLVLDDPAMLETSRLLRERVAKDLLPDGGFHYIWSQNESCGYHNIVVEFLARTYEITGDESVLDLIRKTEWYGPVSAGPIAEYWTAPSWKHTWNSALRGIAGGDFVATATENPYVRGMLVEPERATLKNWFAARPPIAWYRRDLKSQPLPENVLFLDRNIAGPRGRFGTFTYAATLRDIPVDEPGHATLMGAMTTTADFGLNAILFAVGPRVLVGTNREDPRSWAALTSGMTSSLALSRTAAAFAATYDLAVFRSSTKGPVVPARGEQIWLALNDRIVGLLRIRATDGERTEAFEGALRLGTGGTVNGPAQKIRALQDGTFAYGDLRVVLHGHNFAAVETVEVPFRLPAFPVTEIQWQGGELSAPGWYAVEIRPAEAPPARVEVAYPTGDVPELRVATPSGQWTAAANVTAAPVELPANPGNGTTFFLPGEAPRAAPPTSLAPGQVLLTVTGGDADAHAAGWESFAEMVKTRAVPSP